jgi:phospholipid/cholesterol/gamma-HCH transport system substrate-binding protein
MPSRIEWSELKVGIAAATAIVVSVVSILLFARVGALHGDTEKIYVTAPDVSGVLKGTEVWIAGKEVGQVADVRFRPITSDTLQRVLIEADILVQYMPLIRRDSWADIRPGGNLIGSMIVYIKAGTPRTAALKSGDTLASKIGGRIAAFGSQVDTLADKLVELADRSGNLVDKLSDPTNSVGAFRSRGIAQLRDAGDVISMYRAKATQGNGSLALAYRNDVVGRMKGLLAEKDSIFQLVNSPTGNVGRFRKDSTLMLRVSSVRAGIDSLRSLTSGAGITKLRGDTSLSAAVGKARREIDSLMIEIKKHPRRYISF